MDLSSAFVLWMAIMAAFIWISQRWIEPWLRRSRVRRWRL